MSSKNKSNLYSSQKKSLFNQQNKKKKNNETLKNQKNVEKNKLTFINSNNFNKLNPKTLSIICQQRNFNININQLEKLSSVNNALIDNKFNKKVLVVKQENIKNSKENNEHKAFSPNQEKIKPSANKARLSLNKKTIFDNKKLIRYKSVKNKDITPNLKIEFVKLISEGDATHIISCLYSLANIQKLNDYMLNIYSGGNVEEVYRNVTFFFSRILLHLKKGDKIAYKLSPFYDIIEKVNCCFKTNKLINASNFLLFLLDQLHQEDKKFKKLFKESELIENIYTNYKAYMDYLKQEENSFIFSNFSLINEKKIKCLNCQKVTQTYTYFFTYDLNIESAINKQIIELKTNRKLKENFPLLTIEKFIEFRNKEERLYNVYCDSCDRKTNLIRTSKIYSANNNLLILLNGIEQEKIIRLIKENNIQITINKNLNIENHTKKGNNFEYKINSVIYYDVDNKEYFSYCLRNNIWLKCSNNNIKIEKSDEFLQKFNWKFIPVIAFYELSNINK